MALHYRHTGVEDFVSNQHKDKCQPHNVGLSNTNICQLEVGGMLVISFGVSHLRVLIKKKKYIKKDQEKPGKLILVSYY